MAKKFKDYYDENCAKFIADKISGVWPKFESKSFVAFLKRELSGKEFLQRQDVFVSAFERYLHPSYAKNIAIFEKILGPELPASSGMFTSGWWLWPMGRYVEKHGALNFDVSIEFIRELTRRFTGEFAIRTLIVHNPKKALKIILIWSKDKNVHVRRLASEGTRIRLPWAKRLTVALDEFKMYKKILSNLKHDPEKFVQKSVGNNLNDLMKEAPTKAREIIHEWKNDSPSKATLWIIKHGLRNV